MKLNITRARLTEQETEEVLEEDEEEEEEAEETIAPLLSNSVKWWECKRFNNPSSNELIIKKPLSPPKPKPKPKPKWGDFNMLSLVWLLAIAGLIVAAMVYHFFSIISSLKMCWARCATNGPGCFSISLLSVLTMSMP